MNIYRYVGIATPVPVGLLELDLDLEAERFFVIDRLSMVVIAHYYCNTDGLSKIILPDEYTNTEQLIIVLIDDGGVFNAVAQDRVMLEKADARIVSLIP